ncbi:MAG: TrbC/VirB2 family protein [Candidatus Woesearchaeota archaeon]
MEKNFWIFVAVLVLYVVAANAALIDDLSANAQLTEPEKASLATALGPIGKLIAVLQYVAGVIVVLGIIAAGFTYYKGDVQSKHLTLQRISALVFGSILVFGATTIARILGIA